MPVGWDGDAVEVGADADVVDAGDFNDVIEVIDERVEGGAADFCGELAIDLVGGVVRDGQAFGFVIGFHGLLGFFALGCLGVPGFAPFLVDEGGEEVDHDDAVVLLHGEEHLVGHVARGGGEGAGGGVRGDDGRARGGDDVPEGFVGDVGDVDHHAKSVHLLHDLFAEGGEAVVVVDFFVFDVAGGVGPVVGVGPGEGHVTDAEAVVVAEKTERVFDGVAAFDAHEDAEFSGACMAMMSSAVVQRASLSGW